MTLADLPLAHRASIVSVAAPTLLAARMAAMGLLPGSLVLLLRRGSFGGPLHVRIGATELMIRRQDAGSIRIADAHRVAA